MAYGEKYRSDFYNFFGKLVEIKIEKEGYVGASTDVRTTEASIEINFQDPNTPVIGTGAKVVIVATSDDISQYEDLLTSLERQFKCTITYGGTVVFIGYSLCDLNERQLLPYAKITLQFTDYLRRLDSHFLTALEDMSANSVIIDLIKEGLSYIDSSRELLVNSTLFETRMSGGLSDTFLEQTYVENNAFFENQTTFANTYDVFNRLLISFGMYLYSIGNAWVLERMEDVGFDQWSSFDVAASANEGTSETSHYKEIDKQAGDFKYVESRQIISYVSGLQKLILNLQDQQLESAVFNNYTTTMVDFATFYPLSGSFLPKTWYKYNAVNIMGTGYALKGMNSYVKWEAYSGTFSETSSYSLAYNFEIQFNVSEDKPTVLSVNFKAAVEMGLVPETMAYGRFAVRVDGGPYADYWLTVATENRDGTGALVPQLTHPHEVSGERIPYSISSYRDNSWNFSQEYNLTDRYTYEVRPLGLATNVSIWELLGKPMTQRFTIHFFPTIIDNDAGFQFIPRVHYLGDIQVMVSEKDSVNKLTYYVNENFLKVEEIDLEFYDMPNVNFNNGLRMNNGEDKTLLWVSARSVEFGPLVDLFATHKFRNYSRTTHTLKASILYDGYLKPFTVIRDTSILADSGQTQDLLLQSDTWDLYTGVHDIVAEEYPDETVNLIVPLNLEDPTVIGESEEDSSAGIILTWPQGLHPEQQAPGYNSAVYISWYGVYSATRYRLQRKPNWRDGGTWRDQFETVYEGPDLSFIDNIQDEGTPEDGMTVTYRVCAVTDVYNGPYSPEESIVWALYP